MNLKDREMEFQKHIIQRTPSLNYSEMKKKYNKRFKRVITGTCTHARFKEFYQSMCKICKAVKLVFQKLINGNTLLFELRVAY